MVTVAAYTPLLPFDLASLDFSNPLSSRDTLTLDYPFADPYLCSDLRRSEKYKMEAIPFAQYQTHTSPSTEPSSNTFDLDSVVETSSFDEDIPGQCMERGILIEDGFDLDKIRSDFDCPEGPYSLLFPQGNAAKETEKFPEMSHSESTLVESPASPTAVEPAGKTASSLTNRRLPLRRKTNKSVQVTEDEDFRPSYKPVAGAGRRTQRRRGGKRQVRLWEFIKDLLENKDSTCYIRWVSKEEGTFRLLNSGAVAKMWGKTKNRPDMTYEKMSRAMRYYYAKGILLPIPQKLTYKFGEEILYTMKVF